MIRAQARVGVKGRVGWGSTFGVFYCSSLILRRYDVCLLRRQCLISYYISIPIHVLVPMIRAQARVGVKGRVGWGSTFGVFYCSSLILCRYDVCLLRRQCLISYYISIPIHVLQYVIHIEK